MVIFCKIECKKFISCVLKCPRKCVGWALRSSFQIQDNIKVNFDAQSTDLYTTYVQIVLPWHSWAPSWQESHSNNFDRIIEFLFEDFYLRDPSSNIEWPLDKRPRSGSALILTSLVDWQNYWKCISNQLLDRFDDLEEVTRSYQAN